MDYWVSKCHTKYSLKRIDSCYFNGQLKSTISKISGVILVMSWTSLYISHSVWCCSRLSYECHNHCSYYNAIVMQLWLIETRGRYIDHTIYVFFLKRPYDSCWILLILDLYKYPLVGVIMILLLTSIMYTTKFVYVYSVVLCPLRMLRNVTMWAAQYKHLL